MTTTRNRDKNVNVKNGQFLHVECGDERLTLQWDENLKRWSMMSSKLYIKVVSIEKGRITVDNEAVE